MERDTGAALRHDVHAQVLFGLYHLCHPTYGVLEAKVASDAVTSSSTRKAIVWLCCCARRTETFFAIE